MSLCPEVAALPKQRQFSAAYKRRIVGAADACQMPGGWMRYCAGKLEQDAVTKRNRIAREKSWAREGDR